MLQRLGKLTRTKKKLLMVCFDAIALPCMLWLAVSISRKTWTAEVTDGLWAYVLLPLVALPIFTQMGLYHAVIRYMEERAFYAIFSAVTLVVLALAGIVNLQGEGSISVSALVIFWLSSLVTVSSSRVLARAYFRPFGGQRPFRIPVAIYGAGQAGVQLSQALKTSLEYEVVAFFDDNKDKQGYFINGVNVYHAKALLDVVNRLAIQEVLLATPTASIAQRKQIVDHLEGLRQRVRTIPSDREIISGERRINDFREISVDDLLGREPVPPDNQLLTGSITGKCVMVTGAGGSIGSELCRQIVRLEPTKLVLFERSEFALYMIERELEAIREKYRFEVEIVPILGSVSSRQRSERVMRALGVEMVFHAAAYKHVPLVEHNVIEGVRNNVMGTLCVAEAANAAGVKRFVLISTDKAVRPTNVMGATKRLAELVLQGLTARGSRTCFSMVRFGNVLDSSGSVVPLFRSQIMGGGPITITHPEITRYFMTIPEAAQLVLQAASLATGGEVFLLDMGAPVKIMTMARRMIHLSGLEVRDADNPDGDIEIKIIGLRPGEKLFEELLIGDHPEGTAHPLIMHAREESLSWDAIEAVLVRLERACSKGYCSEARNILLETVSGYAPNGEIKDPGCSASESAMPRPELKVV